MFDFTTKMNRQGQDAIAWDRIPVQGAKIEKGYDKIPMWVADMNFPTFPGIISSIQDRLSMPHFGYFDLPQAYYDAIIYWHEKRHDQKISSEEIGYENGVLGGVSCALQAFSNPNDPILVHSPTYIGFTGCLKNNNRTIIHSKLKKDEKGIWRMDFDDMEEKIKKHSIKLCIFCSPHNPTGRVWEKWEIEKAMQLFKKYDCIVLSDEIWSDILLNNNTHIPTSSISEDAKMRTISFYAPSKTFSLAGLVGAYHILWDQNKKKEMDKIAKMSHYNTPNLLSVYALIGAYTEQGEQWVNELCEVLSKNVDMAMNFFSNYNEIEVSRPQGTYMLYLDLDKYVKKYNTDLDTVLQKGISKGVIWQDGRPFQMDNTIRSNLALPSSRIQEALNRLKMIL